MPKLFDFLFWISHSLLDKVYNSCSVLVGYNLLLSRNLLNRFIDTFGCSQICENITIVSFNSVDKGCDFIEITMSIELILDECGYETIAMIEVFDGAILLM